MYKWSIKPTADRGKQVHITQDQMKQELHDLQKIKSCDGASHFYHTCSTFKAEVRAKMRNNYYLNSVDTSCNNFELSRKFIYILFIFLCFISRLHTFVPLTKVLFCKQTFPNSQLSTSIFTCKWYVDSNPLVIPMMSIDHLLVIGKRRYPAPCPLTRCPQSLKDEHELIGDRRAGEKGTPRGHLEENASDPPVSETWIKRETLLKKFT